MRVRVMRLTRGEKIMVLDWGRCEMVMNSCFEDLEESMRVKRMWKLIPRVEKKEGNK